MPVFAPTKTLGLQLKYVRTRRNTCGPRWQEVYAQYGRETARVNFGVFEGHPLFCGDLGEVTLEGHVRIHGRRATVYGNCFGDSCDVPHSLDVRWCERGTEITLIGGRTVTKGTLVAIARSMQAVDDASALKCGKR